MQPRSDGQTGLGVLDRRTSRGGMRGESMFQRSFNQAMHESLRRDCSEDFLFKRK